MIGTSIEWADDTVNPWWGCAKVSTACQHCYAEALDHRFGGGHWGAQAPRKIRVQEALGELRRIARRAHREGRVRRVFVASMADIFEERTDLARPRLEFLTTARQDPLIAEWTRLLLLTKRPEVMAAWADDYGWCDSWWAGTTVEDQTRADERVPHLLRVPAPVRFLSCEPLLGPLDLAYAFFNGADSLGTMPGIGWIIAGGESGPKARPSHPDWFRGIQDDAQKAGVPFFFKQWGEWAPGEDIEANGTDWPGMYGPYREDGGAPRHYWPDTSVRATLAQLGKPVPAGEISGDTVVLRVGRKAAGRRLDGVEYSEVPR